MTLDEAIKHCEEVAEQNEKYCQIEPNHSASAYHCAEQHRQLAEWLRELKALYENDEVKDVFKNCDTCKYQSLEPDDFPCDRCCHRYCNQYIGYNCGYADAMCDIAESEDKE